MKEISLVRNPEGSLPPRLKAGIAEQVGSYDLHMALLRDNLQLNTRVSTALHPSPQKSCPEKGTLIQWEEANLLGNCCSKQKQSKREVCNGITGGLRCQRSREGGKQSGT